MPSRPAAAAASAAAACAAAGIPVCIFRMSSEHLFPLLSGMAALSWERFLPTSSATLLALEQLDAECEATYFLGCSDEVCGWSSTGVGECIVARRGGWRGGGRRCWARSGERAARRPHRRRHWRRSIVMIRSSTSLRSTSARALLREMWHVTRAVLPRWRLVCGHDAVVQGATGIGSRGRGARERGRGCVQCRGGYRGRDRGGCAGVGGGGVRRRTRRAQAARGSRSPPWRYTSARGNCRRTRCRTASPCRARAAGSLLAQERLEAAARKVGDTLAYFEELGAIGAHLGLVLDGSGPLAGSAGTPPANGATAGDDAVATAAAGDGGGTAVSVSSFVAPVPAAVLEAYPGLLDRAQRCIEFFTAHVRVCVCADGVCVACGRCVRAYVSVCVGGACLCVCSCVSVDA